jgi:hypothetical protein
MCIYAPLLRATDCHNGQRARNVHAATTERTENERMMRLRRWRPAPSERALSVAAAAAPVKHAPPTSASVRHTRAAADCAQQPQECTTARTRRHRGVIAGAGLLSLQRSGSSGSGIGL